LYFYQITYTQSKKPRIASFAFIECELRGRWLNHKDLIDLGGEVHPAKR